MNTSKLEVISETYKIYKIKKGDLRYLDSELFWMGYDNDDINDVPNDKILCVSIGNDVIYVSDRMFFIRWW